MTMQLAETLASFQTLLASRGVEVSSLRAREDGTLGASSPTLLAEGEKADPSAVVLASEELAPGALLGRGGMGEVRLAVQRSLRREVAVKTVLERHDALSQAALLKEAWAGGALEHPSVVPIHTLARLDGEAAVVMKRVAGVSWAEILAMPDAHPRFCGPGALEAHLRVFVHVCHAIDFAHERGILHLDLKPENVMIGDLGEVYVLDWGLAASTEGGPAWLPPGKEMSLPAGTPGYMAPELAAAIHDRVGARTDVYLLGALLHHVVTGRMRHEGDNLFHTLFRAYTDDPPAYGPEVPRSLAAILTRAMQRENDARFESARALREAVEAFLQHREAEHFLERAEQTLAKIDGRLAEHVKGDAEAESLLAEAEVALFQVRKSWSSHPRLREVEQGLVERRIAHAVAEGRLEAARELAREIEPLPAVVAAQIRGLEERLAARALYERGLEEMERELDFSFGTAARRGLFGVLGLLWAVFSIALGLVHRSGVMAFGYRELFVESILLALVLGPFAWLARARYLANRANRRLWGGISFLALAVELFFASCAIAGIGVEQAIAMTPVIYAFGFATLGIALDRRLLLGAPPLLLSAFAAAAVPRYSLDLVGVGGGVAVALVLWAWRSGGERKSVLP